MEAAGGFLPHAREDRLTLGENPLLGGIHTLGPASSKLLRRRSSRFKNNPTSVTTPYDSNEPRSLNFVTTAGLMSTQTIFTPAGVMLPTPMEWSIDDSIRIMSAPRSSLA